PVTDLFADALDGVFDERSDSPVSCTTADIENETPQERGTVLGMRDFGVELHTEHFPFRVFHRRNRVLRSCRDGKPRRRFQYPIAMTHPDAAHPIDQTWGLNGIEFA